MKAFAFLALIPMVHGPLPQEDNALVLALCGGGEISIPFEKDEPDPQRDCHQGCHAGNCREKFDRDQGRGPKA